jgi:hypothetical protein
VNDIDVLQWSSSSSSTTDYGSYALNMMRKDNLPKARDTEDDYLILEPSEDDMHPKARATILITTKTMNLNLMLIQIMIR